MSRRASTISTILLNRARAKVDIGNYAGALEDLKKIEGVEFEGLKCINIGLCYFKLGINDEAEKQYLAAIRFDSRLVTAYFNLAALYNSEDNLDRAKILLKTCLKLDRNFQNGKAALKSLSNSGQLDWYEWWFKTSRTKQTLGTVILIGIFALIALFGYLAYNGSENVGLSVPLGLLVGTLLLPSLKKIKVGSMEVETLPIGSVLTVIEPIFASVLPTAQFEKQQRIG